MAKINIGSSNQNDPLYRYKRDQISVTTTRRNCKTILVNIQTIANQLDIESKVIVKYLQLNLNCQSGITVNSEYYLKGLFTTHELETD
jgi:translation initiation factor 2 beta subunit (eIF-2beta)/eIF-5